MGLGGSALVSGSICCQLSPFSHVASIGTKWVPVLPSAAHCAAKDRAPAIIVAGKTPRLTSVSNFDLAGLRGLLPLRRGYALASAVKSASAALISAFDRLARFSEAGAAAGGGEGTSVPSSSSMLSLYSLSSVLRRCCVAGASAVRRSCVAPASLGSDTF